MREEEENSEENLEINSPPFKSMRRTSLFEDTYTDWEDETIDSEPK